MIGELLAELLLVLVHGLLFGWCVQGIITYFKSGSYFWCGFWMIYAIYVLYGYIMFLSK